MEKGTPGLSFGKQEQYMGLRGLPGSDLVFEDCIVPEENVVVADPARALPAAPLLTALPSA